MTNRISKIQFCHVSRPENCSALQKYLSAWCGSFCDGSEQGVGQEEEEAAWISSYFLKTNLKLIVAFLSILFNLIALDKEH